MLKETLFAPQMHATLVLLGRFDDAGYSIVIGGGHLTLFSPKGRRLAYIPKDSGGLYRVQSSHDLALSASNSRTLSLYELHCALGHVSYGYLRKLIASNSLAGLTVDPNCMEETQCSSYIKAKITCAPIAKVWSSPLAKNFGDVIHMDV